MNIRNTLSEKLQAEKYDCTDTILVLRKIPEFAYLYSLLNSKKRSYNLEKHTIMVCNMFENYFSSNYNNKEFEIDKFRLLLCLHDIGKPLSIIDNQKEKQSQYTIKIIDKYKDLFPFSENHYRIALALISDDPLGLYIRGKIDINEANKRIINMVLYSGLSIKVFMELLTIYYQVDASAYTREGYIGIIDDFIEKPKLEAIFAKSNEDKLIYLSDRRRFLFSVVIENKYEELLEMLGIGIKYG